MNTTNKENRIEELECPNIAPTPEKFGSADIREKNNNTGEGKISKTKGNRVVRVMINGVSQLVATSFTSTGSCLICPNLTTFSKEETH